MSVRTQMYSPTAIDDPESTLFNDSHTSYVIVSVVWTVEASFGPPWASSQLTHTPAHANELY